MGVLALVLFCFLQLTSCGLSSTSNTEYVDPEYLDMLLKEKRYEEFSKLLQITNVDLVRPGQQALVTKDFIGLHHGDMLLRPWQFEEMRQNRYPARVWPSRVVPYSVSLSTYTRKQNDDIEKAIYNWNKNVIQVQFRRKTQYDRDYVFIFRGKGTFSNLGKEGGHQAMSIHEMDTGSIGAIQHEMMHTIGFSHEHNRPDRDRYIRVLYPNIPDGFKSLYGKRSPGDFNAVTDYDYYSIMHYDPYLLSPKDHKPAFEVLQKNIDFNYIGQREGLTSTDHLKIQRIYG